MTSNSNVGHLDELSDEEDIPPLETYEPNTTERAPPTTGQPVAGGDSATLTQENASSEQAFDAAEVQITAAVAVEAARARREAPTEQRDGIQVDDPWQNAAQDPRQRMGPVRRTDAQLQQEATAAWNDY